MLFFGVAPLFHYVFICAFEDFLFIFYLIGWQLIGDISITEGFSHCSNENYMYTSMFLIFLLPFVLRHWQNFSEINDTVSKQTTGPCRPQFFFPWTFRAVYVDLANQSKAVLPPKVSLSIYLNSTSLSMDYNVVV